LYLIFLFALSLKIDAFQLRDWVFPQESKGNVGRSQLEELFEKYRNERHMPQTTTATPPKEIHSMIFEHAFGR